MTASDAFFGQMEALLNNHGLDYAAFLEAAGKRHVYGARANTLKIRADELPAALGATLGPVPWCAEGFYSTTPLTKHPLYAAGLFYAQEPSAMCPASVLDPAPGAKVLDLCAAPGGKAAQLAARLSGRGFLLANDISATRCKPLLRAMNRAGVTNAAVTCESPERLADRLPGFFDAVLADAPCSGEGMFRKDPRAVKTFAAGETNPYPALQLDILRAAARLLSPGGRLAYSTCTFNTDENEGVVARFLAEHSAFTVVPLRHEALGIDEGIPFMADECLRGCGRIWPHRQQGEGHFVALLAKQGGETSAARDEPQTGGAAPDEPFLGFARENLSAWPEGIYTRHGRSLFVRPTSAPELTGLRVVSGGFYLGDEHNGRFVPSQTLAMALTPDMVKNAVTFPVGDERVTRYLKGESFEVEARPGWCLVCAGSYPLGWGKMQNGRIKNKIERWVITQ